MPEPLEIDVPQADPKVVISSQFLADSGVVVSCTRTFSALSDNYMPDKINYDFINKAFGLHSLVLLEHSGITDTLYNMGLGLYMNENLHFEIGEDCYLTVYDSIVEQTVTSNAKYIQDIDFDTVFVEIQIENQDTNAIVFYEFTDYSEDNNYLINSYIFQDNQNGFDFSDLLGENPYADMLEIFLEESEYNAIYSRLSSIGSISNKLEIFKDSHFQSQNIADSVVFRRISLQDTLAVSIANISQEYYDYCELRLKAGTIYSQLISDPINMPSNIENGYGMFTTHSLNIWMIDLSQKKCFRQEDF